MPRPSLVSRTLPATRVVALLLLAAPATLAAQDANGNVFLHGDDLPWGESNDGVRMLPLYGNPGADGEAFAFRLEVSDGFELGPHTHPVTEHMTVLSGRFFVGLGTTLDRDAATEYGSGSYVAIAAGVPAYMWAVGATVVQVHGTGPFTTEFVTPPAPSDEPR